MIELLRNLSQVVGPSGFEQKIAQVIYEKVKPLSDSVKVDPLGNIIATLKGRQSNLPSILVSAHIDEVGFIVKKIEKNGFIRFEKIGGHDDRILLAQRVQVMTKQGPITGVIGTISAHYQRFDDINKIRRYQELYIDCGAESEQEAKMLGISVGDPVSWATSIERLGNHRIVGKAFDDRAGCAVQILTMERLINNRQAGDAHFLFSVQEEVGLRGASVGAYDIYPQFALAIDTTAVGDTPENVMDHCLSLGAGPAIKVIDNSFIASPAMKDHLIQTAEELEIPYQQEIFMGIGTDAGALHKTKGGIPTGVISIPSRYAHSPVEVVDMRDLQSTVDLLEQAIRRLPNIENYSFIG